MLAEEEFLHHSAMLSPTEDVYEEEDSYASPPMPSTASLADIEGKSLDEVLGGAGETFQQRLLKLIDASGMDDVTVYKKANIDRKVFSRIRCKEDYRPSSNAFLSKTTRITCISWASRKPPISASAIFNASSLGKP